MKYNRHTIHATRRAQQRAIPPMIVDLLEECGSSFRNGDADVLIFDKAGRRRLCNRLGGVRNLRVIDRWLKAYAVLSDDGKIITVGFRYFRLRRDSASHFDRKAG